MNQHLRLIAAAIFSTLTCGAATIPEAFTNSTETAARMTNNTPEGNQERSWNWHVQSTVIVQGDPSFPALYSGPNSLDRRGEIKETVSLDLFAGVRLWRGAEAHVDGLMWQGIGFKKKARGHGASAGAELCPTPAGTQ